MLPSGLAWAKFSLSPWIPSLSTEAWAAVDEAWGKKDVKSLILTFIHCHLNPFPHWAAGPRFPCSVAVEVLTALTNFSWRQALSFLMPPSHAWAVSKFPLSSLSLLPLKTYLAFVIKYFVTYFPYTAAVKSTWVDSLDSLKEFVFSVSLLHCLGINRINCFTRTWNVRWYWK